MSEEIQDVNNEDISSVSQDVTQDTSSVSADDKSTTEARSDEKPDGVKDETLKDHIKKVMDKQSKVKSEEAPPEGEVKNDLKDSQDEEDKSVDTEIRNHPAFKKIQSERKAARAERDKVLKELETYKPQAEQFTKIDGFLKENSVSSEDAGQALKLVALSRSNPREFARVISDMAKQWSGYVGEVLPDDLQTQVNEGLISEDLAKQYAKTRADANISNQKLESEKAIRQTYEANEQQRQRETLLNSWIDQATKIDPNLNEKMNFISSRMMEITSVEGYPKNQNEVWDRLNRAYTEVNESLKKFQPVKPIVHAAPQTHSGGSRSATIGQDPDNLAWERAFASART